MNAVISRTRTVSVRYLVWFFVRLRRGVLATGAVISHMISQMYCICTVSLFVFSSDHRIIAPDEPCYSQDIDIVLLVI
jgi:hypothetical protein